jgi:hypothetical protein
MAKATCILFLHRALVRAIVPSSRRALAGSSADLFPYLSARVVRSQWRDEGPDEAAN